MKTKKQFYTVILILIVIVWVCMSTVTHAQAYKNITVNEKIHYQDDSLTSCYIVITDVIVQAKDTNVIATYQYNIYKLLIY